MLTILAAIGATIIITQSKLFAWTGLTCTMCVGFWAGFFLAFNLELTITDMLRHSFETGCITSLGSYTYHILLRNYYD